MRPDCYDLTIDPDGDFSYRVMERASKALALAALRVVADTLVSNCWILDGAWTRPRPVRTYFRVNPETRTLLALTCRDLRERVRYRPSSAEKALEVVHSHLAESPMSVHKENPRTELLDVRDVSRHLRLAVQVKHLSFARAPNHCALGAFIIEMLEARRQAKEVALHVTIGGRDDHYRIRLEPEHERDEYLSRGLICRMATGHCAEFRKWRIFGVLEDMFNDPDYMHTQIDTNKEYIF